MDGSIIKSSSRNSSRPSRPARLVFLLQDLKFGGTQRQILELARRLDPVRFRPEIWLLMAGDDLVPLAREWGLPLTWLARHNIVGPAALLNLWRRLHRRDFDLLMACTVVPNIWGRLLGRLARVPVLVGNCRGGGAPKRQHERWLWPLTDHILCNTRDLQVTLTSHHGVPPARLTVIPNGVDTEFFQPPPAGRPSGSPKVLSVARMVPDKDHETLIRAFHLVAAAHPDAELWLIGDGSRREALQRLAGQLMAPGRVSFFPGQKDLRPWLHQADLLVLSSVFEALPNVVLEAMATGLPVVATRVGGLPEVVISGETGWLVPPRDVPALAAALGQLLTVPEIRRELGRAGRQLVLEEFSMDAMLRGHEKVFRDLLNRAAARRS